MRRLFRRRRRPVARPRPQAEQICAAFTVPVTYLPFTVEFLDGTKRPWSYRAVLN